MIVYLRVFIPSSRHAHGEEIIRIWWNPNQTDFEKKWGQIITLNVHML